MSAKQKLLAGQLIAPRVLYQIEWDQHAQAELLILGEKHDACLFGNIADFFRDELTKDVERLLEHPDKALQILGPLVKSGNSVRLDAHCLRHGRRCSLKRAKRHVAGTSCTAFSKQGLQLGT
eukprot:2573854-Karenia_brevis.AAC.1